MIYKGLTDRQLTCFLALFAFVVLGSGIWSSAVITQGDESDYIRSSREMYRSGDFLTPTLRDEPRFTKPPLLYWMQVLSYKVFGVSLFSSRLPSVIAGVALCLGVFRFGSYLYGREAGLLSALLTTTSFGMVKFSKIALMEIPLALFLLLSFYSFVLYLDSGKRRRLWFCFFCLGLSSLLKSPVYAIIALGIIVLFLAARKSLSELCNREYLRGVAILLLIAVPWYFFMLIQHGNIFYTYYMNEHIDKFFAEEHYLFRVWTGLFFYLLPWSFLFLFSIYKLFTSGEYLKRENLFMLLWIGVFLIIFLFPNQKSHYYSIPMVPPAMLLVGGFLAGGRSIVGPVKIVTASIIAVLIVVMAAALILVNPPSAPFSAVAIISLMFSFLFILRKGTLGKGVALFGVAVALFYTVLLPSLSISPIPVPVISKVKQSSTQVFTFRLSPVLYSDLLNIEVKEVRDYRKFDDLILAGGVFIIREADYEKVKGTGVALSNWKRWRRRIPFVEGIRALRDTGLESLKERVLLVGGER